MADPLSGPKFHFLAAHGGTIAGIMAGVQQRVTRGPKLGSIISIEVFRSKTTQEIMVNWKLNNQSIDIGPNCVKGDCPLHSFMHYLESRFLAEDV